MLPINGNAKWAKPILTTLTLSFLTTRHLVPRLHCNLVASQQEAQATSRFLNTEKKGLYLCY